MTYKNTYKKFLWLAKQSEEYKKTLNLSAEKIFFDEMETIEHTKCKPLSVFLMVNENYEILEAKVAKMPAKGKLADFSRKKYGRRIDERDKIARESFSLVKAKLISNPVELVSDAKTSYGPLAKKYFSDVPHFVYARADKDRHRDRMHENCHKKKYDPMFALNQRCAKLRAQVRPLTRRSWCTTKKPENLQKLLDIFVVSQHGFGDRL